MLKKTLVSAAMYSLVLAAGCAPAETGGGGTGGATVAGSGGRAATGSGGGTTPGSGGSTAAGTGGSTTVGTGGSTTVGTGGSTTVGTGGGTTVGTGGGTTVGTGGSTTVGTGGRGGATATGGAAATGGRGTGGAAGATAAGGRGTGGAVTGTGGAATGTGGAGTGVTVSSTCMTPTWPTASGSVTVSGTMTVTGILDGMMRTYQGSLNDCSVGGQSSTDAMFEIADGGTIRNVVMGTRVGDGIHCLGNCTIDNVWFPYICDDAITMLGGAGKTATIRNSGFKGARDKAVQHNGDGSTVVLENIYVETAGKLYRSCGEGSGCGAASAVRTVRATNITAIGVGQVLGVSSNDKATLTNICAYRTPQVCHAYQPGSDTDATSGANGVGEGPGGPCTYTGAQTHALVNKVTGNLTTDVLCPGPNSIKTGATATNCVAGFDTCLKGCAPGSYGFKQVTCTAGKYADAGATACMPPSDPTVAGHLASTNSSMATTTVTGNGACTTQWAWGKDSEARFCVCVMKPGYYQASSGWYVWDCQTQWW